MGFMTGEKYQCQECDEILVMPIEFDNVEDYLNFLKVQSPEKFKEVKDNFKIEESEINTPDAPQLESEPTSSNEKLSHLCIFEGCQKGKRGGTDYCRKHWLEGHDVEF
tara:strand:+ start:2661 stop:2984 length:324 start_codon:yes stop_codon:yes gene_type:complete